MNKDSYLILEKLPTEYDSRVKAMEVDERPTEQYSDIGGLDKQIEEVSYCITSSIIDLVAISSSFTVIAVAVFELDRILCLLKKSMKVFVLDVFLKYRLFWYPIRCLFPTNQLFSSALYS